jgi:hypothetical protein
MNQVRSKYDLKMSADQFCEIEYTFQTIHWIELKFYRKILDTLKYIVVNFKIKWSSET